MIVYIIGNLLSHNVYEEAVLLLTVPPIFNEAWIYMIPNRFKAMSMTAITIKIWIQLPVCGKLGLMFRPKKPSSHSITRITMMVHNMRFLLFELFALYSFYNNHSPATSTDRGVLFSAIWGIYTRHLQRTQCGAHRPDVLRECR